MTIYTTVHTWARPLLHQELGAIAPTEKEKKKKKREKKKEKKEENYE